MSFLASLMEEEQVESQFDFLVVVLDFPDVFLEELPRLPPLREIEFTIDLDPGTEPISIAPYRMEPLKLKELRKKFD